MGWKLVAVIGAPLAAAVGVASPAASASPCSFGLYDNYQQGTTTTKGLEGDISDDAQSVNNVEDAHALAWGGLISEDQQYWGQAGNGVGCVSGTGEQSACKSPDNKVTCVTPYNVPEVYAENMDVNGYHCHFYSSLTLDSVDYYSSFVGEDKNGVTLIKSYYDGSSGVVEIDGSYATGEFGDLIAQSAAESHVLVTQSVSCPDWPEDQTYGLNSSGQTTSNSQLELSSNGTTWSPWTANGQEFFNNYPYSDAATDGLKSWKQWGS